jgi:lipid-A-disaccharide synthase
MGDEPPLTVAMVAGEPSGDRQGAALLQALREQVSPRPVRAWGIGGDAMRVAGVELRHDSTPWASIGVSNTLSSLPRFMYALSDMKRALAKDPPDVLVIIDAGAFNVPLGQWVRRRQLCPVFYYFPPGSWRRTTHPGRHRSLAMAADRIVTPFPWSEGLLRRDGADAYFVGHPLLDQVGPTLPAAEFYDRFGLDPHRPLVALLPGSRRTEVTHILPAMIGAAEEITRRIPGVQFAVALPSPALRTQVAEIIERQQRHGGQSTRLRLLIHQAGGRLAHIAQTTLTPPLLATNEGLTVPAPPVEEEETPVAAVKHGPAPLVICEGLTYDVLARSDLVITKSGTSTLEAAILQKPMIIVYRGSALMEMEWRVRSRFLKIAHIGLPNILADERIVPELIQEEATPAAISELAVGMLLQPERLLNFKQRLADLVQTNLGEPGGVHRAAALLYDLVMASGTARTKQ